MAIVQFKHVVSILLTTLKVHFVRELIFEFSFPTRQITALCEGDRPDLQSQNFSI